MAKVAQYYDYLTTQGVMIPDTSTVLTDIQAEMKTLFGQNLDTAPSTPQGRLIEMFQRSRTFTIQAMAAISNMFNLNRANGFMLDDLGALFLISRQSATYTTVSASIGGVPGTVVPAGTRVQTTLGDIFILQSNFIIGTTPVAFFRAESTGPVPCPPNTLTQILDATNGFETVTNPGQPTLGTDLENDALFRERIRNSLNINAIAVLSAIKSNLEALPGVVGSYVMDNFTGTQILVDTIIVPNHCILAVVDGGDPAQIAKVLYTKKTLGAGYAKSTTEGSTIEIVPQVVTDEAYGTNYDVYFARPDLVPLSIKITIDSQNYTGSDLTQTVQNAVLSWAQGEVAGVDGLKIGTPVSPFEISAAVSSVIPEIFIKNVEIAKVGGTLAPATISMDEVQKGSITVDNITVTIGNDN